MPAPASTEDFLALVRKSNLLEPDRLNGCLTGLNRAGPLPPKPDELAQVFVREGLLTHFQAKQLLLGRWRRFHIGGKYKLLELLGAGGMGAVYLCEHVFLHRLVALKVLPPDKLSDPSAIDRFKREARASAALTHPNIVHTYDFDTFDKLHFLVLEFVDGSSLQEVVARHGPLAIDRATNYVWQTAQGLQHAHESGLLHRDVKPGNLLLDRTGVLKILDMGLALFFNSTRQIDNVTQMYDEKCVLGTADYLAPEQAMRGEVDIRCDVYSLGATWYFLLTGQTPFPDGSVAQKLLHQQLKEPTPVESLRPDVPAELVAVLRTMMAKKPEDRFQAPVEVAEALEPFLVDVGPPPGHELPRFSAAALSVGRVNDSGPRSPSPTTVRTRLATGRASGEFRLYGGPVSGSTSGGNGPLSLPRPAAAVDTMALPPNTPSGADRPSPAVGPAAAPAVALHPQRLLLAAATGGLIVFLIGALVVWALWPTAPAPQKPAATSAGAPAGDQEQPLAAQAAVAPDAARQRPLGEICTVEFPVASTGGDFHLYLNSRANYRAEDNFSVCIPGDRMARFGGEREQVRQQYEGRWVRATGRLRASDQAKAGPAHGKQVMLVVAHPDNLVLLDRAPN